MGLWVTFKSGAFEAFIYDNMKKYEDILTFIKNLTGLWYLLPFEISQYWREKYENNSPEKKD